MIDKNLTSPEERALAEMLETSAQHVDASPSFKRELEKKLMNAHKPKTGFGLFSIKRIASAAGWTIGLAVMALIFIWAIRTITPQPQPAAGNTPFPNVETTAPESLAPESPLPKGEAHDWNGTTLYLNAPLPETPPEANIYFAQPDQLATIESARALAKRFGIEGQVYLAPGELPDTTNFMVTAGGPRIYVRSDNYFSYYKNYGGVFIGAKNLTDDQAAAAIDAFLKSHGFDFEYQIEHAPQIHGNYYVVPQLDGLSLRHDYMLPARIEILLDDNGQVLSAYGALLGTQTQPLGTYGIRSAQEAFQQILNNAQVGVQQSMHSGGALNEQVWFREYSDNESFTLYGEVRVFAPAETGKPPLITINDYTLTGNTVGLEDVQKDFMVEIIGQFITKNGIRTFRADSWKNSDTKTIYASGFLHKDGNQVFLTGDDGNEYPLIDAPADAPLNTQPPNEQLIINGIMANGQLEWTMIQYFPTGGGGGGGGGGGSGFYKLNLTGTPVPLPTPIPLETPPSPESILSEMPPLEGTRGTLRVLLYQQADGSLRPEYSLLIDPTAGYSTNYIRLEGDSLEILQSYDHRPIDVWATPDHIDEYGMVIMKVSRFEVPYPDLESQIIQGAETLGEVNGQTIALVTTEQGTTYAKLFEDGSPTEFLMKNEGDQVLLEVFLIPNETFGGFPSLRVLGGTLAVDPSTGKAMELPLTANEPEILPERNQLTGGAPILIIEKVELVYYTKDPRYETNPSTDPAYIQPAWRFSGHYNNGDEFQFLVQALKDEFLLPELAPDTQPG